MLTDAVKKRRVCLLKPCQIRQCHFERLVISAYPIHPGDVKRDHKTKPPRLKLMPEWGQALCLLPKKVRGPVLLE